MKKPKPIEQFNKKLGKRIRQYRVKRGMKVNDFLDALADKGLLTTRMSLNNWEQGRVTLGLSKIELIAKALRVRTEKLI